MKKPRIMKIGKVSFFHLRNDYGEITICVDVYGEEARVLPIGIAFCNPTDFNLKRDIRVQRGHGIAAKRAKWAPNVPGSYLIQLPDLVKNIGEEKLSDIVEERIVGVLRRKSADSGPFGFPPYRGEGVGDFVKWVIPFCKELSS